MTSPAAKKPAPAAQLKTGSYSFVSGYKDAATVEVKVGYDPERFSFAVIEDSFPAYSSDSHVAVIYGEDFTAQIEYAGYYHGEDFAVENEITLFLLKEEGRYYLQYSEDSRAQVDLNCVMNELGEIIELQGTGEGRAFTLTEQQELVRLCAKGNLELLKIQKEALGGAL